MKQFEIKEQYDMEDYRALIHLLRAPGGCAWDRAQTHESIRRNVLEEAYETAHAIDTGDTDNLREELGDLLMQVLLHSDMEEARGTFDLDGVADTACKKLVFRHPHVFGAVKAEEPEAVLRTWEEQKRAEKGQKTATDAMVSVAENLPALWRAEKIQKKAADAGFERADLACALTRLRDKTDALTEAAAAGAGDGAAEAVGELLYCAVNAARLLGADPESALHRSCEKEIRRCALLESGAAAAETGNSEETGTRPRDTEGQKMQVFLDKQRDI